jgi:uncharacterized membrane protein
MTQNRFKSPIVWGAIIAQVLSLGQLTGLFAKYGIDAGVVGDVLASILQLAIIVGILNDPTNKEHF